MATWIAHLRIAENLLNHGLKVDIIPFVAGNIAPDAGVQNEDWSSFSPSTTISHWKDENDKIQPEMFYDKYIKDKSYEQETDKYSFLIGYYVHLLADVEWYKLYTKKCEKPLYHDNLSRDPQFIWEIKKDWYGLDFKYLKENKDSLFFTCFQKIDKVKDYLDYFPKDAFNSRFLYIKDMYLKNYNNEDRDFKYLSKYEMDNFVEEATRNILNKTTSCTQLK